MSYTKQTWANGDIITASKLNHIEDGIESVENSIEAVETELTDDYAKADGYYEALTAGNAEQLISSVTENDKVPYNFRTSGGSIDIGDREVDKLIGGTIAWNQLVQNGNFASTTDWNGGTIKNGTVTNNILSATATAQNQFVANLFQQSGKPIVGHKMLYTIEVKADSNLVNLFCQGTGTTKPHSGDGKFNTLSRIVEVSTTAAKYIGVLDARSSDWTEFQMKNAMVFDLTQMFGSAIADYIYTLETNTAGAGAAYFRKLFPKPYYAYDAGTLMSVKTSAHKTVGFNAWDEEWELGIWNSSGAKETNLTAIRSKNYIHVVPNTTYFVQFDKTRYTSGIIVRCFDADKNFVETKVTGVNPTTISLGADIHFITFCTYGADNVTTYNHDICINLSWDGERDGEYEAYVQHTYALDSDLELRGIPKLDANNSLYYDGDEYASDGTVTRKYGIRVLNGTESWAGTPSSGWYTDANDMKKYSSYIGHMMADKLFAPYTGEGGIYGYNDAGNAYPAQNWIYYRNSSMERPADVKAYFAANPVAVIYELAEPTTEETADPYQNPQIVDDFGTEEYIVTEQSGVAVPVGHETTYQANLRAKLEMAPDSPDGDGDYIVRQSNGQNSYVPITFPADELPAAPTEDGNYVLKCTVADGAATFTWASAT